ncbi:hypothetical protein pb186bvf_020481 [Paramecium bursaria]
MSTISMQSQLCQYINQQKEDYFRVKIIIRFVYQHMVSKCQWF